MALEFLTWDRHKFAQSINQIFAKHTVQLTIEHSYTVLQHLILTENVLWLTPYFLLYNLYTHRPIEV
jgi:hypothetical protein